jgi:peptidoglycan/xylan/chitin deacetylase (PgdA/CDA1 family)
MYKRDRAHGVMFHHFHDAIHPKGQGSISADDFRSMIDYLGRDNILSAKDWLKKAESKTLRHTDLCLTFDDNLLCQYEVAYPIMKSLGLTAFWFVYTSPLSGHLEKLEVFRYFRSTKYDDVEEFYQEFFESLGQSEYAGEVESALSNFVPSEYLKSCPFYTDGDRRFRYVRDFVLKPARYEQAMELLLNRKGFDTTKVANLLWMQKEHLRDLHQDGNVIGLHSHSHPMQLALLTPGEQEIEYQKNYRAISDAVEESPYAMSHPCNSYQEGTFSILRKLGIRIGFRANMMMMKEHTEFEFPREDHANVFSEMQRLQ